MIPFAKILDTAKKLGFTGDTNDEKLVRSFVADALDAKRLSWPTHGGQPVTRALIVAQPDANTVVVTDDGMGPAAAANPDAAGDAMPQRSVAPFDIDARVAAAVEAELRKAKTKNPAPSNGFDPHATAQADPVSISVRSGAEVQFEDRKNRGQGFFDTFEKAVAWRDAFVYDLSYNRKLGFSAEDAAEARKGLITRGIIDRNGSTITRAYATAPQAAGGALTSQAFLPDLLKNANIWGVARQLAKVVPMDKDNVIRPRHSGADFTGTYQTDNAATTASTNNPYSALQLNAKTFILLNQVSKNLMADAGIDVAQDIAEDYVRAVAKAEDNALLIGDGTATYGGMTGFTTRLTTGTKAGLSKPAANQSAYTDAHINNLISLLPDYAWVNNRVCFVCHIATYTRVFSRLSATTPGGLTLTDFDRLNFKTRRQYRGIPVVVTNAMNSTDAASTDPTVDILLGDFSRASMFGDRLSVDIAIDESYGFNAYSVYIRGVARHDVNVHDVGDATTPGPVVALAQS